MSTPVETQKAYGMPATSLAASFSGGLAERAMGHLKINEENGTLVRVAKYSAQTIVTAANLAVGTVEAVIRNVLLVVAKVFQFISPRAWSEGYDNAIMKPLREHAYLATVNVADAATKLVTNLTSRKFAVKVEDKITSGLGKVYYSKVADKFFDLHFNGFGANAAYNNAVNDKSKFAQELRAVDLNAKHEDKADDLGKVEHSRRETDARIAKRKAGAKVTAGARFRAAASTVASFASRLPSSDLPARAKARMADAAGNALYRLRAAVNSYRAPKPPAPPAAPAAASPLTAGVVAAKAGLHVPAETGKTDAAATAATARREEIAEAKVLREAIHAERAAVAAVREEGPAPRASVTLSDRRLLDALGVDRPTVDAAAIRRARLAAAAERRLEA